MKKNKKTRIILIVSWVVIVLLGFLILRSDNEKLLEDELLPAIAKLKDSEDYNFKVETTLDNKYSPLYQCKKDIIPQYLFELAEYIDPNLEQVNDSRIVKWVKDAGETILLYDIDTTILNIYLDGYPTKLSFVSVERFISNHLDSEIKYGDIEMQVDADTEIYTANRILGDEEMITGYGKSDFFYIENGYLTNARVLLAQMSEAEYAVPLINEENVLERYINDKNYPKDIIINTSEVIELDPYTYENFDPEYRYENCIVNASVPQLYFSSCNQEYTYYVYEISGVCDITYENTLYSVPFRGFINAVDPEYVKSIE
jgi:hypothetical protein